VRRPVVYPCGGRAGARRGELEGGGVEAVSAAGGWWPVREHVPQVPVTAPTPDFHALHPEARVAHAGDVVGIEGLEEARPSGAGFELGAGAEQREAAEPAPVGARLLLVQQGAAERTFRPVIEQNVALVGGEPPGQPVALRRGERREIEPRGGARHAPSRSCRSTYSSIPPWR
jgi:hypothetical protein